MKTCSGAQPPPGAGGPGGPEPEQSDADVEFAGDVVPAGHAFSGWSFLPPGQKKSWRGEEPRR